MTEEYEEIPAEEKLAIATHLLLSSPPGEINEVLKDVQTLCPESVLTDAAISNIYQQYNTQNLEVISDDLGKFIISENNQVVGSLGNKSKVFKDGRNKRNFDVDHVSQVIVKGEGGDDKEEYSSGKNEAERDAIDESVSEYISAQYQKKVSALSVVEQEQDNNIVVELSSQKLNLRNYWGGRWRASYIVNLETKTLTGHVKILVHYFEDGNVQMVTEKNVETVTLNYTMGDANSLGKAVANAIGEQESLIQDTLEEMYCNMAEETFKDMRRILPISKQKMDWSGAQMKLAKGFKTK